MSKIHSFIQNHFQNYKQKISINIHNTNIQLIYDLFIFCLWHTILQNQPGKLISGSFTEWKICCATPIGYQVFGCSRWKNNPSWTGMNHCKSTCTSGRVWIDQISKGTWADVITIVTPYPFTPTVCSICPYSFVLKNNI